MNEVENFELGAILSIITDFKVIDDSDKMFELAWFVCNDNLIGTIGLMHIQNKLKEHLLTIHPELKEIKYKYGENVDEFILRQEEKFGHMLPVTRLGEKLPEDYNKGTAK